MTTGSNEQELGGTGRSWVYCETCDWARIVRSATARSAFALAEDDARTHAALTTYEDDPHSVHVIDTGSGEVVVHD
ncbi:hypothetical protein [Halomarina oriensis]|uniref:Uncharacterized protein n=1 Tax=Halomarina oriensis TaxID=671145 RepID=A0A6B0GS01_9EURY|nr:hypothetical protein [Halomarina oriensis]MWG35473.1 hypothetical protein [Halomarina oriensis]